MKFRKRNEVAVNDTFSSTPVQRTTLLNIAQQCPVTGGSAVYEARTLLSIFADSVVDFPDYCPAIGAKLINRIPAKQQSDNVKTFNLYPNPNNGSMTLEYDLNEGEKGSMILSDITGKQVGSYSLNVKETRLQIQENSLKNGVYYYEIRVDDKIVYKNKLVIIQ